MKVKTAIRVISLEASLDRRNMFSQMAAGTKLGWEFFPAYKSLQQPLTYDGRTASRRSGRPMSLSEIGCYTSHFKLWEWLTTSEYDQAIILEDDAIVEWAMIEQLASTRFSDYGINLLRLFATHPFKWKLVKHRLFSPHTHLIRISGMTYGMQGYLLTKEAACILVSKYAAISAPIDWILVWYWEHHIINYCLFPFPIIERYAPSTIGGKRHTASTNFLSDHLIFLGWKLWDKLRRAYVERCVIKKYALGPPIGINDTFIKNQ